MTDIAQAYIEAELEANPHVAGIVRQKDAEIERLHLVVANLNRDHSRRDARRWQRKAEGYREALDNLLLADAEIEEIY